MPFCFWIQAATWRPQEIGVSREPSTNWAYTVSALRLWKMLLSCVQ